MLEAVFVFASLALLVTVTGFLLFMRFADEVLRNTYGKKRGADVAVQMPAKRCHSTTVVPQRTVCEHGADSCDMCSGWVA